MKYYYKTKRDYINSRMTYILCDELCLCKNKSHNNKSLKMFEPINIGSSACKNCNNFIKNGKDDVGNWIMCKFLINNIRKNKLLKLKEWVY